MSDVEVFTQVGSSGLPRNRKSVGWITEGAQPTEDDFSRWGVRREDVLGTRNVRYNSFQARGTTYGSRRIFLIVLKGKTRGPMTRPKAKHLDWQKEIYGGHLKGGETTDCYVDTPKGRYALKRSSPSGRDTSYWVWHKGVRTKQVFQTIREAKAYVEGLFPELLS